ncbi:hypothetical protein EJB05_18439 [Eragrostis curvula]|uniref:Bowman-Birk serine protease inhibitors family domain-containing protein n=1 Tax=Eragrostis curvula TaxID=38414 RepID=A0A5J9VK16_9POAL|nr:hypothetical protein EJB05_18439 [Eragrostis curvula]
MKPQALLITLVVVAVLAAVPLAQGLALQRGAKVTQRPCCNECGDLCTRSFPPQCKCMDAFPTRCHPGCRNCDKFIDSKGATLFQCQDMMFCKNQAARSGCTPVA